MDVIIAVEGTGNLKALSWIFEFISQHLLHIVLSKQLEAHEFKRKDLGEKNSTK